MFLLLLLYLCTVVIGLVFISQACMCSANFLEIGTPTHVFSLHAMEKKNKTSEECSSTRKALSTPFYEVLVYFASTACNLLLMASKKTKLFTASWRSSCKS